MTWRDLGGLVGWTVALVAVMTAVLFGGIWLMSQVSALYTPAPAPSSVTVTVTPGPVGPPVQMTSRVPDPDGSGYR